MKEKSHVALNRVESGGGSRQSRNRLPPERSETHVSEPTKPPSEEPVKCERCGESLDREQIDEHDCTAEGEYVDGIHWRPL